MTEQEYIEKRNKLLEKRKFSEIKDLDDKRQKENLSHDLMSRNEDT